jgi:predicted acyl esterase
VVSQDCRGTGGSEPDYWDYFVYETEDGYDCVEWITQQDWYGGFIGSYGGSYIGQTQWPMAMHPRMSTIIPSNCALGVAPGTVRLYMFLNAFAQVMGKGEKLAIPWTEMERYFEKETMAGGYFNEPLHKPFSAPLLKRFPDLRTMPPGHAQRWLWEQYCAMTSAQRAEFIKQALDIKIINSVEFGKLSSLFGQQVSAAAITIPYADPSEPCRRLHAPPLIRTGWYDWNVHETLATWETLRREAKPEVAERARLIISHCAHNMPGYQVGGDEHPELLRIPSSLDQVGLMTRWYNAVAQGTTARWPRVIYYLMGANEWRVASDWPVPEARQVTFYLGSNGSLTSEPPQLRSRPDPYTYDPTDPTPTVGGSIVSFLYRPGSLDVSKVQERSDVLTYTSATLEQDLDIVGRLRMILYASSSALDTDFAVRLSDVFPDGRAIALQSGMLRARYRNIAEPEWLEPGRVYRFEIDLWATANRFKAGHRLRVDISSADFPHYDRNSNRGGDPGEPIAAMQAIYHDPEHPSHLVVSVLSS